MPETHPPTPPIPQQPQYPRYTDGNQAPPVPVRRKNGGKIALIVVLVLGLLAAGIVGVALLLKAKHEPGGAGRTPGKEDAAVTEAADAATEKAADETKPAEPSSDPTAAPVTEQAPVPGAAENDYSILYGVWTSQSGDWQIYILPDGTYHLSRPDGYFTGSVRSADGGYGLYLADGTALPGDSLLSFDGEDKNCLLYGSGDSLVYLYRSAAEYEGYDYNLVTLYWGEEAYEIFRVYDRQKVDQTDYPAVLMVRVDYPVTDFQVLDLELKDVSQAGELSFNTTVLYEKPILLPRRPLELTLSLTGDIPNRGISFTDPSGNTRRYYISVSGYDGTYGLTEF